MAKAWHAITKSFRLTRIAWAHLDRLCAKPFAWQELLNADLYAEIDRQRAKALGEDGAGDPEPPRRASISDAVRAGLFLLEAYAAARYFEFADADEQVRGGEVFRFLDVAAADDAAGQDEEDAHRHALYGALQELRRRLLPDGKFIEIPPPLSKIGANALLAAAAAAPHGKDRFTEAQRREWHARDEKRADAQWQLDQIRRAEFAKALDTQATEDRIKDLEGKLDAAKRQRDEAQDQALDAHEAITRLVRERDEARAALDQARDEPTPP